MYSFPAYNSTLTVRDVAAELLRRSDARASLLPFITYTFRAYVADPVHLLLASVYERVLRGELRRVIITMPPQIGKSEIGAVRFPAWWLGKRPNDPVVLISYSADLAQEKSRECRQLIESAQYSRLFEHVRTRRDSRAVDRWQLQGYRGGMLATGVGGSVTGFSSALNIIDDPYKNWAEAQSPTIRKNVRDFYKSTLRTRLQEGGAIVFQYTRWHEDDIAADVIKDMPGKWTVIRISALGEAQEDRDRRNAAYGLPPGLPDPLNRQPGESLAPRRFSAATLLETKTEVGTLVWEALYCGCPIPAEGRMFKREWFEIVDAAPVEAKRVRRWDNAAQADDGDYSVGVKMARTPAGLYYVEDVIRGQYSSFARRSVQRQTAEVDGEDVHVRIIQDPGSAGKDTAQYDMRALAGFSVSIERETGSKEVRAQPFSAQCEAGNVKLVRGEWNKAFIEELCAFPNGSHDDQVDPAVGAFSWLAKNSGGVVR